MLLAVAGVSAVSAFGIPGGIRFYVVQSGSMEPAIKTGSLIVDQAALNYKTGDIITFKKRAELNPKNPGSLITHRVVEATTTPGGQSFYTTRGDANNSNDLTPVNQSLVLGKVILALPYLGYLVAFTRTPNGFILLIVVPAAIIIYSELVNIKNEVTRLIRERKGGKE